jgi:hypothetical protein
MGVRRLSFGVVCAALAAAVALPAVASAASPWSGDFRTRPAPYTFSQAPDWMPDGKRVAWHAGGGAIQPEQIVTTRLDGTDGKCLTCLTDLDGSRNMVPLAQPGGKWVLFHSWHGHNLTVGAPGFGGMGSDLWVARSGGNNQRAFRLTTSEEGHDNFHAYWSPNGKRIVWTALNWNFITEDGNGKSEIRVARFRTGGEKGPRLVKTRTVRPPNGHWYETQWWAPDGSGFLYTESIGTSLNNELFFCRLPRGARKCDPVRLTNDPAWDEQAIFTPDMRRIIFMSTRDHPGAFNDYEAFAGLLGLPADYDYALVLPVFEFGFLQPVFEQANDLYELRVERNRRGRVTGVADRVRRLTRHGDDGWVTPEFSWEPTRGRKLLFTQLKINDGVRIDQRLDLLTEIRQAVEFLLDPEEATSSQLGIFLPTERRTLIGRYEPRRR